MADWRTLATATMLTATISACPAWAGTLTTLYGFTGGLDGGTPVAALLYHRGELFGTTLAGGADGQGIVFKVKTRTGVENVLHSFVAGTDGENPSGALIFEDAALFGTTAGGGGGTNCLGGGCGTIYRVDPGTGDETIVHHFHGAGDGGFPFAGLVAHQGRLFGTTGFFGGGYGTVFRFNDVTGAETVLHRFGQTDGHEPRAPLIGEDGFLYGTTAAGGNTGCAQEGCGTVFKIDPANGDETLVHVFAAGPDGAAPNAGLVAVGGSLYGTTTSGGSAGSGTVYRIDTKTGAETVIHSFDGGTDGGSPSATLVFRGGLLYGTTALGGMFNSNCVNAEQSTGCGTIFAIDPRTGAETVLHRFTGGADGASPASGLVYHADVFYGTTSSGGPGGAGTVFKLPR